MHASGESASTIAATLGVSRATVYRVLAESTPESDLAFDATSALAVRTAAVSLRAIPVTEGEHSSYVAGS